MNEKNELHIPIKKSASQVNLFGNAVLLLLPNYSTK